MVTMSETIKITAEVELDDVHAQMLEQLREEFGDEAVDADLREAAIDGDTLRQSIYAGYQQLQQQQSDQQPDNV